MVRPSRSHHGATVVAYNRYDAAMNKNLARKNIRAGLIAGGVCAFLFGMTFIVAAIYLHP